jgi:ABC-type transporter Mla maintaining outer membrane lipid asymmetry ATPase subunit MlaF/molybdopterin-guanine dinucleotide biosynthesis protein A
MGNGDFPDLTAFILAGGKSTRMGADKAFVMLDGQTLLARALELAHSVTTDVRVVGDPARFSSFAPVVEDVFPDCGPLGGIHAALRASATDLNVILAVDTPFVSPALLRYLITRSKNSPAATVTLVRTNEGSQPLCAVYRRAFADTAEQALHAGRYKIDPLFTTTQTQMIAESELRNAGFSLSMFRNLNTPEEVATAIGEIKSHEGITSEFKSPRRFTPDDSKSAPYIEFKNVYKAFGDNVVLDHVSFDVLPAETVCILGRSGVGKSVSLHHIMGFLKPDSGRVIVAGQDITDYTEEQLEEIRKKVTMVFQNGALFDSLTVGENVAFPLRESRELNEEQTYQIVDGLLQMVGVQEMRDLLPSDLSTGMKRSVAIARALAARPECVLYDEPTTMVDPLMAQLLGDLIKRLKIQLNLTSIVVTHDMRLAKKLADRVVFLHEGKAIFFGPYSEMEKSHEPIIQEFLELDEVKLEV